MVVVRVADKKNHKGYRLEFFDGDEVTDEIIRFVKKTKKTKWVEMKDKIYYSREDFLAEYKEGIK